MTKEVLVKISGLQFAGEEDSDAVEIITSGNYYKKNGKHYIIYDEVSEGSEEVTKNVIKIWDSAMEVTRKGPASVHMMFEKDKKNVSYYYTPFGSLLVGIDAKNGFGQKFAGNQNDNGGNDGDEDKLEKFVATKPSVNRRGT